MVTDQQAKRLWRLAEQKLSLEVAAAKAGMDPKTARKYLRGRRLSSEMQQKHAWRTRPDPFVDVWDEIEQRLKIEPGLQAKTVFEYLQQREPAAFFNGIELSSADPIVGNRDQLDVHQDRWTCGPQWVEWQSKI